jgi:hypothetical protein
VLAIGSDRAGTLRLPTVIVPSPFRLIQLAAKNFGADAKRIGMDDGDATLHGVLAAALALLTAEESQNT